MGVEDPGEDEEEDADAHGKLFNPFETPLQLIEMLVLSPVRRLVVPLLLERLPSVSRDASPLVPPPLQIRRSLTNSLKVFVRRHCKKAKVGESITLDELVQAYSRFCYQYAFARGFSRRLCAH